jgi:hypothetical protein
LTQDYCGSCHGGFESTLALPDLGGDNNIRFQAYRLFRSDGHNGTDARISCIACHDPHTSVRRDAAWYDAKCLACHLPGASNAASKMKPCPKERANCATCHMPKVELAGMHAKFTDHWIRVARPGDATPK